METASKSSGPRFLENFDWPLLGVVLVLCTIGLMTLYSSTYLSQPDVFLKQLAWVGIGLVIALIVCFLDYRIYESLAYPFYFLVLGLLVIVDLVGKTVAGSQRWLPLGPIHLQPSELAKLAMVFVLARFYSKERLGLIYGYGLRELIPVFILIAFPMGLIFLQPDLGTALMTGFVSFSIILFCNLRIRTLIFMTATFLVAAPLVYHFILHEYQRDRVRTFLNPERDPLGEGYHALQGIISVGSGQLFGKGYLKGTQSKLEFLPKHHTDFIFSAFAEEWGFMGSLMVIGLFLILIFLGIDVVRKSKDKFGSVLALGALSTIVWHVFVNIGMEIGLLPVVGVTLPFFSYGGSAMITNMVAVGILLSVSMRRHIF